MKLETPENIINDLSGKIFNMLTVLEFSHMGSHGNSYWICKCDCGNTKIISGSKVKSGEIQSCGCLRNKKRPVRAFDDLSGRKFGMLSVLSLHHRDKHRFNHYLCRCDCGVEKIINGQSLKTGKSQSCGCGHDKPRGSGKIMSNRLYRIYRGMTIRCCDVNSEHYLNYGKRGITICDQWLTDFTSFCLWAKNNGYAENLILDRIDNDKGYSPDNCRWATPKEQANNRRDNKIVEVDGIRKSIAQWCDERGLSRSTVWRRLKNGWSDYDAITKPAASEFNSHR